MPLTSNLVEYETDDSKKCMIVIKYEDNNDTRVTKGGFTASTGQCGFTIPRKWLKPRYIDFRKPAVGTTPEKVERVYYKTHTKWKQDISANSSSIVKACGECLSCTAIGALYSNP